MNKGLIIFVAIIMIIFIICVYNDLKFGRVVIEQEVNLYDCEYGLYEVSTRVKYRKSLGRVWKGWGDFASKRGIKKEELEAEKLRQRKLVYPSYLRIEECLRNNPSKYELKWIKY